MPQAIGPSAPAADPSSVMTDVVAVAGVVVDAATMRTTIGADNASNLTSGTLNDARLPSTMSGKTFVGSIAVNNGAGTGYAVLSTGNTTSTGYIDFRKADGNRAGYIGYAPNAGGNIDLNAEAGFRYNFTGALVPTYSGSPLVTTAGATFTGAIVAPGIAGNDGNLYVKANGNRHVWFQDAAGVNRGIIYHDNVANSFIGINLYNTSGTYVRGAVFRQDGSAFWAGQSLEIGGNSGTAELRLNANANMDYRILGDSGGSLYIQRSPNEWNSAATAISWDPSLNATHAGYISSPSGFLVTAPGNANGFLPGSGDNATYASHNVRISTWWGLGIWDAATGACRIVFDARGGHITNTGNHSIGGTMYVGGAAVFGDGNVQFSGGMLGYGAYLSDALSAHGVVYTGSNHDEVSFPVGHSVLCYSNGIRNRNQGYATYLSTAAYQYTLDVGAGAQLGGTWRARGQITYSGGNSMVQMQRTA